AAKEGTRHAIANLESRDTAAYRNDFTRAIRQRNDVLLHGTAEVATRDDREVAKVQRGGMHLHEDFTGTGFRLRTFDLREALERGAAGFDDEGFHCCVVSARIECA